MVKKANPSMIVLARESRGMTQSELAQEMKNSNITQGSLSKIEQGLKEASDELLEEIATATKYPVNFFYENHAVYPPHLVYHRKRKSLSKKILMKIDAETNVKLLHLDKLLGSVEIPESKFPRYEIKGNDSPTYLARCARGHFQCPRGPIKNVTELIENVGGIVIHSNFTTPKLDGFTMSTIFINRDLTGDRMRFTLCHELGHLIMHLDRYVSNNDDPEAQANEFASEFLMPEDEIRSDLAGGITINKLANLKRFWKVSMQALLHRAQSLNLISPRMARHIWMTMSKYGYRTREPVETDIPIEKPQLFSILLKTHKYELDYSKEDLAELFRLRVEEFEEEYENDSQEKKPKLKLYKPDY
jgi:Zn-dependent peptidase ImmA (M78 family)/DNA-binding XRE family transcriptional regulator